VWPAVAIGLAHEDTPVAYRLLVRRGLTLRGSYAYTPHDFDRALEVLLGLRSPAEMLRAGADEGRVSGVFDIHNPELLKRVEKITDVQVTADGGELLLTRRLYSSGRSSVSLNGNPITLSMLKQVAEHLVDVHGQHDHQYLLKPSNQLDVLDQFGGLWDLRRRYHETYEKLVEGRRRLEDLSASRTLREQQLELYRFQADEIDDRLQSGWSVLVVGPAEHVEDRAELVAAFERIPDENFVELRNAL